MKITKKDKKYFILMAIFMTIEILCALVYSHYGPAGSSNPVDRNRYVSQTAIMLAFAVAGIAIWITYRYYLRDAFKFIYKKVEKKVKDAVRFISKKITAIINKMGFGGRKRLAQGNDEYSFTFDEDNKAQNRLYVGNVSKWKDLQDNNQKIRFLFIRYMLKRIRRGYRKRRGKTPSEWAKDLKVKGETLEFFGDYNTARYSGGRVILSDDAVERAKNICEGKKG